MSDDADSLALLVLLKKESYNFQTQKNPVQAKHKAKWRFYHLMQEKNSCHKGFRDRFNNCVDVVEHCGGTLVDYNDVENELTALSLTFRTATDEQITQAKQTAKDKLLGVSYLMCVDRTKFGKLLEDVENAYLTGVDQFPKSVNDAYHRVTNWSNDPRNVMNIIGPTNDGLAFAQDSGGGSGNNQGKKPIQCYACKEMGHKSYECPYPKAPTTNAVPTPTTNVPHEAAVNHVHISSNDEVNSDDDDSNLEFSFHTKNLQQTPDTWVLLDNQSTVDVFFNAALLENIRVSDSSLDIYCNAGVATVNKIGNFPGYGTVWYHPGGIANILSLARVKEKYQVTFDSLEGNQFVVHKGDGSDQGFAEFHWGRCYKMILVFFLI